jgi:exodeoxyribonuclease V alpha subunit
MARPAHSGTPTVIEGILDRVSYASEESGWSVVKVQVPGRREGITCVGNLLGVQPGESLRLSGHWEVDRQYGEQFRVESYSSVRPATLEGIERYLGSGLVRGIGRAMAARIVRHFGLETMQVIDETPGRLREVEGIGPVRSERILRAWEEQRQIRQVMVFLQSHGVSTLLAVKIYKQYRERAVEVVTREPYRLAEDVYGIGFKTADRIARSLGIAADAPERIRAGAAHVLSEQSEQGHLYTPRAELAALAAQALEIEPEAVDRAIGELALTRQMVVERDGDQEMVFLASLHAAESGAAERLAALARAPARPIEIDVERAITWFEERQRIALAPEQKDAIRRAVTAKVLVITGGPGTGKTTLVNAIIQILEKKARRILLAAPTGRAAKRMTEATGREARTIHRLLEFSPKDHAFQRNRESPLEADLLVLDEVSMVDVPLFNAVLKAVPPPCQLVLVGDVDQLPSVGPGSVLADVIRSGACEVVRLSQIFRQAQQSQIVVNAHRINQGQMPRWPDADDRGAGSDFYFYRKKEPEEVLAALKSMVAERIPRRFGLDPVRDVQVLTPMHRGPLGAVALNVELQKLLNPSGPELQRGGRTYRQGDKVMQLRNNYDLETFNGDIGRIQEVDLEDQQVRVDFDGRLVTYDASDLDELALSYAATIHKSQGSEYPCVVIPVHTQHYVMLARNLLYTGVTRGKRLVVLVGSARALAIAVKNDRSEQRRTRLAERLRALATPVGTGR